MPHKHRKPIDAEVAAEALKEPPDIEYRVVNDDAERMRAEAAGGAILVYADVNQPGDWSWSAEVAQGDDLPYMQYLGDVATKVKACQWARYYAGRLWVLRNALLAFKEHEHDKQDQR